MSSYPDKTTVHKLLYIKDELLLQQLSYRTFTKADISTVVFIQKYIMMGKQAKGRGFPYKGK